jgi:uncharacterized protein (DUF1501 family)
MKPTRRELLKAGLGSAGLLGIGATVPSFLAQAARAQATQPAAGVAANKGNVLVVVQLTGGNDGLNTVIPFGNDDYLKARPGIGIKDRFHALNDALALHPNLAAFKKVYDDGKLAVINGCGYPGANRSHFRSMEIWHTASPSDPQPGGWLGHYLDHYMRGSGNPLAAVNIGADVPQALVAGGAPVASLTSVDNYGIRSDSYSPADAALKKKLIADLNAARTDSPAMEFLAQQATDAIMAGDDLKKLSGLYKPDAKYPGSPLALSLLTIAQILSADLGTRIFYCQQGGFDTHSNQPGYHAGQLTQLSDAIHAFHEDMTVKGLNDRVAVLVFSEFGRRVAQNGSYGTDHGAAGPVFLSGGKVKGGLHGAYPSLTDLDGGDLKYTTDFRTIYAAILENWLGASCETVIGKKFQPMAVL